MAKDQIDTLPTVDRIAIESSDHFVHLKTIEVTMKYDKTKAESTSKREEQRKKMEHKQAIKDKVQDRLQHNSIPSDWNDEAEQAYQEKLRQEQKTKEWRERIRQESEMRERSPRKVDEAIKDFEELLADLNVQAENRKKITEKMRLTGDNAYHEFNQMLIDYLESLTSDSQRLEACYNGIKIFKAYIRDHNLVRA